MQRRDLLTYAAVAVGTVTLLALLTPKRGQAAVRGYADLRRLAEKVDPYISGFSRFAQAVAYWESRGNSSAMNTDPGEAAAACRGFHRQEDTRYADNPYPEEDWCWGSGGWFGLIPSTALAAPGFSELDPLLVLDPEAQVTMFADFIRRVTNNNWGKLPPEERTWLAVRRFMAGNTVGLDWREEVLLNTDKDGIPRSRKVRERFAKSLQAMGIPTSFMHQRVHVRNWPGALEIWKELT